MNRTGKIDMTETLTPARRFIENAPGDVIARLPRVGNLMIIGKRNGATHERIGVVERVTEENGLIHCSGSAHDSHIDPALIKTMLIDVSSIMNEKVYPRIDFDGADGEPVFSVVGFGGLEPFEAALAGLNVVADPANPDRPPRQERPAVLPEDTGLPPLNAALASAQTITIAFEQPGFFQRWTGIVPKVSPGMGFINVMTEDFHLHLLGATVSRWQENTMDDGSVVLVALDLDDKPTGLTLFADNASAFQASADVEETA
jgi:hypothetical protein